MSRRSELKTVPFTNNAGTISFRVRGMVNGERVRKNFPTKEEAEIYRLDLLKKILTGDSRETFRPVMTRLDEVGVKDAEAARFELDRSGHVRVSLMDVARFYLANNRSLEAVDINRAIDEFLKSREEVGNSAETRNVQECLLNKFVSTQGLRTTQDITRQAAMNWIFAEGLSKSTQVSRRSKLSSFVSWLVLQGWIEGNIVEDIQPPKVRLDRPAALTLPQVEALIGAARDLDGGLMLPYFALCVFSGVRPLEALRITDWESFDLDEHKHVFISEKVSKTCSRYAPLCERVVEILADCKAKGLLPGAFNRATFRAVRAAAGVDFPWKGPYNDVLRHTYCSMHYALNKDLQFLSHGCGNSVAMLRKHYIVPVPQNEAEKFFGVKKDENNSVGNSPRSV